MKMRFLMIVAIFLALMLSACPAPHNTPKVESAPVTETGNVATPTTTSATMDAGAIVEAYGAHRNVPQVQGSGVVVKVLKDDKNGLQHQKFLLKVSDNITILIAHNIDLAPRVADIQEGDVVAFKGEYVYTPKGGTVHWTHKDPRGNHQAGWLQHNGKTYD